MYFMLNYISIEILKAITRLNKQLFFTFKSQL